MYKMRKINKNAGEFIEQENKLPHHHLHQIHLPQSPRHHHPHLHLPLCWRPFLAPLL